MGTGGMEKPGGQKNINDKTKKKKKVLVRVSTQYSSTIAVWMYDNNVLFVL